MTSIVVTGASGFIGQALSSNLVKKGAKIIRVSRSPFPGYYNVRNYFKTPIADVLVHLAEVSDRQIVNRLGEVYASQSIDLAHFLASKGYSRIIYVSSGAVYGDSSASPHREDEITQPYDVYTKSKLSCEKIFLDVGGLVVRLSNIYGPSMSQANVVSHILKQMPLTGAVQLKSDKPIRDFLWIQDVVEAITEMSLVVVGEGIFNVASGVGTSIRQLCEMILGICGQENREIISTSSDATNSSNVLDISRTTAEFGWHPRIPLHSGLNRLIMERIHI